MLDLLYFSLKPLHNTELYFHECWQQSCLPSLQLLAQVTLPYIIWTLRCPLLSLLISLLLSIASILMPGLTRTSHQVRIGTCWRHLELFRVDTFWCWLLPEIFLMFSVVMCLVTGLFSNMSITRMYLLYLDHLGQSCNILCSDQVPDFFNLTNGGVRYRY